MSDLISRAAVIEAVHDEFDGCLVWDESGKATANEVERIIASLPSAQPERKGKWINEGRIIRCNRCKIGYATVKGMKSALTYNFCPNCGADMRGEQDG